MSETLRQEAFGRLHAYVTLNVRLSHQSEILRMADTLAQAAYEEGKQDAEEEQRWSCKR